MFYTDQFIIVKSFEVFIYLSGHDCKILFKSWLQVITSLIPDIVCTELKY